MELIYIKTTDDATIIGYLRSSDAHYIAVEHPVMLDDERFYLLDSAFLDLDRRRGVTTFFSHSIQRWGIVTDEYWRKAYEDMIDEWQEVDDECGCVAGGSEHVLM